MKTNDNDKMSLGSASGGPSLAGIGCLSGGLCLSARLEFEPDMESDHAWRAVAA